MSKNVNMHYSIRMRLNNSSDVSSCVNNKLNKFFKLREDNLQIYKNISKKPKLFSTSSANYSCIYLTNFSSFPFRSSTANKFSSLTFYPNDNDRYFKKNVYNVSRLQYHVDVNVIKLPPVESNDIQNDKKEEEEKSYDITKENHARDRSSNEIVEELNKHIIGQQDAKKSLAIALRDRWRRQQIKNAELRKETTPNNILLIGPSGCGKTELAKRLAAFADAPFVKVVATKYTEVGFVGDDTQSMVQDLADQALADERANRRKKVAADAREKAHKTLAKIVMDMIEYKDITEAHAIDDIKEGRMNDVEIEIDSNLLSSREDHPTNPLSEMMNALGGRGGPRISPVGMAISATPGSDFSAFMGDIFGGNRKSAKKSTKKKIKIKGALPLVEDHFASEMVNDEDVLESARKSAEQRGIIFIDEFDKLIDSKEGAEFRSKRRGVQKELLTLMEGTTVSTRIGRVSTDHILFIASGAFTSSKPSDIMPELQGRLPIRSDLKPLTEADFVKILLDTRYNLLLQQKAMLETEGVTLTFSEESVCEIARVAHQLNTVTANVGARRLKTVIAKILEDIKFDAHKLAGQDVHITKEMVDSRLSQLLQQSDLSKYVI